MLVLIESPKKIQKNLLEDKYLQIGFRPSPDRDILSGRTLLGGPVPEPPWGRKFEDLSTLISLYYEGSPRVVLGV